MRLLTTIFFSIGFCAAANSQNLNTSTSLTLPSMAAENSEFETMVEADFDEEISFDMLFDKMALIESLLYTEDELLAKQQEYLVKPESPVYFPTVKN